MTTTASQETTQLLSQFPQIDVPLLVQAPLNMSVPDRLEPMSLDSFIRHTAYSPEAFMKRRDFGETIRNNDSSNKEKNVGGVKKRREIEASKREFSENHAEYKTAISDYNTLAFSMRRAGNIQAEACAHFCVGLTYDNMGKLHDAMVAYDKFLKLSQSINDSVGEALAYNCMGVNQVSGAIFYRRNRNNESTELFLF